MSSGRRNKKSKSKRCKESYSIKRRQQERAFQAHYPKAAASGGGNLLGEKTMYTLSEIQSVWQDTINPMLLRQFIGNTDMGWKIAWSDRMISFYTSIWIFALAWSPFRKKIKPLSLLGFVLLLLPIALDGGTHMLSDLAGIGQGFRDSNQWLTLLTNHSLPVSFYAGDAFGSFNSLMRLITGLLAGLGVVWLAFPSLEESFA
jgi:uncharacterized membrane protein